MGVALCPAAKTALVQVLSRPDSRVMALLDHEKCGMAAALQLGFIHHCYYTGLCQQIAPWA
jgi:hypothetical protein